MRVSALQQHAYHGLSPIMLLIRRLTAEPHSSFIQCRGEASVKQVQQTFHRGLGVEASVASEADIVGKRPQAQAAP